MKKLVRKTLKELARDITDEAKRRDLLGYGKVWKMHREDLMKTIKEGRFNISEFRNDRTILEAEIVEPILLGGK